MMIRTILVPFSGNEKEKSALDASFHIASMHSSRVNILNIGTYSNNFLTASYSSVGASSKSFSVIAEYADEADFERKDIVYNMCKDHAFKHLIPFGENAIDPSLPSAIFHHELGESSKIISTKGRLTDLIVMGKAIEEDPNYSGTMRAALFQSGRSVIFTNESEVKIIGFTIVIAWNGSAEASRAVYSSMPFYKNADKIYVLNMSNGEGPAVPSVQALVLYLKSHGIDAEPIIGHAKGAHVSEAILDTATQLNADLIVMGGFTNHVIKQFIFGSVTGFMLKNATIPLFMTQ